MPMTTNTDRSNWAKKAIATFRKATGTDQEDALADLLADLMHWSDRTGYSFNAALERARYHYEAELVEAGPGDPDVVHDLLGIRRHLNRRTGQLKDCFVPRFADLRKLG